MTDFIPLVNEPYPDELLYSWIKRLSDLNELSISRFVDIYSGGKMLIKGDCLPLDIRRGFTQFFNSLNCDVDKMELYFQLSTVQFELMFYPSKQQTRILNQIFRADSKLNILTQYFLQTPKVCKECMKEDIEKYGEHYFHRSHQLSGVCVCHKHHTPLYEVKRHFRKKNHKNLYDFDNLIELEANITDYDKQYADYAYQLISRNIQSNSGDILFALFNKVNLPRGLFAEEMAKILGDKSKKDKWSKIDTIIPPNDAIKIIMHYFPNVDDFINILPSYRLLFKKHCNKCKKDYYINQQMINDGWGCIHCDEQLSDNALFKRLVKIGGNNEYVVKTPLKSLSEKVTLYHKVCGEEFFVRPSNFIFLHTRCNCNQRLIRKDAEKKMKPYSHFKLIEFGGMAQPATFKHDICGEEFTVCNFRDFLDVPKCRCCEITPDMTTELFKQKVKDVVGDEYVVLGEVNRREDRVDIKHQQCGQITNFKAYEFLAGSRCPHCYCKTRKERLIKMLKEYADDRYSIIGHDKYRFILYDNKEKREIRLMGKHIVQEITRPTPSTILPTHKERIEKNITTWEAWYQMCIEYKQEFGNLAVGRDQRYKGKLFGDWCSMQRILFNKGELSEDKVRLFKEIDFIFDMPFYFWNTRFEEYKEYVNDTGDYFPRVDLIYNGNKVGVWFLGQRKERKKGKLNPIYEKILLDYYPDFFKERDAWNTGKRDKDRVR